MNKMEKTAINEIIAIIDRQIMRLDAPKYNANSKLDDLHRSVEELKSLRDSKLFEQQAIFDREQLLQIFIESVPFSVRGRVIARAEEQNDIGEHKLTRIFKEARGLLLYDAICTEVDAEHDLNNAMLSRVIRSCLDHEGQVPNGADRDALLSTCPKILVAIESAYQNNSSRNPKSYLDS